MEQTKTKEKNREIDMLNGKIAGKLIMFALPLAFSTILQQLFNSADVAVVGRFAGSSALAAVGSCVALVGIFVNLITGLSVGPNAALANLIGQNKREQISAMLHTILTFGLILGIGLMCLGFIIAKPVLVVSGTPDSVMDQAMLYIRIYLLSIPFMLLYNFGAAALRSYGDSKRPMYYLLLAGVVNVVLNLLLVVGVHLGVEGVAIGTLASNVLSASLVLLCLYRREDEFQFRFENMQIRKDFLRRVLVIGVPAGIQGAIFSVSNIFIQSGINSFGEDAIAGASVGLNFEYFTYAIACAFAQGAVTFTSQNYGVRKTKRMDKVLLDCIILSFTFSFTLGCGAYFFGNELLRLYTSDPDVIQCGIEILAYTTVPYFCCGIMDLIPGALRGMGHSGVPMILSIIGTVGTRIVWIFGLFPHNRSLSFLFISYPVSWILTILMQIICFYFVRKKVHRTMLSAD